MGYVVVGTEENMVIYMATEVPPPGSLTIVFLFYSLGVEAPHTVSSPFSHLYHRDATLNFLISGLS